MAEAEGAAVPAPLLPGLLDEIVVWEILARLPPKSLLRCRAVSPAWRTATSSRRFLLAHHARQPSLPILCAIECSGDGPETILSFDHRAADGQLQPVARHEAIFNVDASCDGLIILYNYSNSPTGTSYSVCNLATRQHAPLRQLAGFHVLGMYVHRPTGEYRLLLSLAPADVPPGDEIACYVFALGSEQPPRHIGELDYRAAAMQFPALLRDSLHGYPAGQQTRSKVVTAFDTTSESFRQMRAPGDVHEWASIFEMDATLGIYCRRSVDIECVTIWVLQNYEGEVWERKYHVKLPDAEIKRQFQPLDEIWGASVVSVNGDVLLLVKYGGWIFCVDTDGQIVANFHRDGQYLNVCKFRLKQTLVQHSFFTTLEGYAVNPQPFV